MKKYYKILQLKEDATLEDAKNSRNNLLKKYHPDVCLQGKEYAQQKTFEINQAYEKVKEHLEEKEDIEAVNNFFKEEDQPQTRTDVEEEKRFSPALYIKELFLKIKNKLKTKPKTKKTKEGKEAPKTKKQKLVKNTLIKDERKQERNWNKIFLDIAICLLVAIAIVFVVLYLTGVIK